MACFYCNHCDRLLDGDWVECEEDPTDNMELICLDCLVEWEHEHPKPADLMDDGDYAYDNWKDKQLDKKLEE